jgi:hypothetical protein
MDAQVRNAINALARELRSTQMDVERLRRGRRGPQLGYSSIDSGALEVRDGETVRARIGWLPDGTVGMVTEGGDPVSAPTTPIVTPSLGGLRVTWDGTLSGDLAIPGDFDHMAVHVSTTSGFTPSAATYVGSIRRAGEGGMLPVVPLPYVPHYVVLVPVTTGGVQGVPSAEATATPLQTSGVDLQADSVEAVHIKAGAVEADKLEAVLALVTTIIAGIPGAARVEMDQDGLRGYNASNELIFAIDSAGNAVFSGDIVASEISGSRMVVGTAPGPTGVIEGDSTAVIQRVQVGTMRAQLAATASGSGQANFLASSNTGDPSTPTAAFAAFPTSVLFALDSSVNPADGLPSVTGRADASQSQLDVWSKRNSLTDPRVSIVATPTETTGTWMSGSGSEVRIRALPDHSSILLTAPAATDPNDAQGAGYIFAQRYSSDIAATSLQSPVWSSGAGPERGKRSMLHAEGARPDRAYTRMTYAAARHFVGQQYDMDAGATDSSDGVFELSSLISLSSARHRPVSSTLAANPTFGTTAAFVDFTSGQWAPIAFKTGWSGWVRITITAAGSNSASTTSALDLGFRLSGGSTVPAARSRAWVAIGGTMTHSSRVLYLSLAGNASYTLTPAWRISTGSSATASFNTAFENSITVEALT